MRPGSALETPDCTQSPPSLAQAPGRGEDRAESRVSPRKSDRQGLFYGEGEGAGSDASISGHSRTESPKEGAPSEQGTTREPGQGQKTARAAAVKKGMGTGQSWEGDQRTWEFGAHLPPVLRCSPLCSACCRRLQSHSQHLPPSSKGPSQALPLGAWELKALSLQAALYTKMGQVEEQKCSSSLVPCGNQFGVGMAGVWRGIVKLLYLQSFPAGLS